jgi:RNA polymerase sigma-70 factor (ECF subfamily)
MDVPDIAAVMGVSVGSAEQLLVRGRRALRQHMASAEKKSENRAGSVS